MYGEGIADFWPKERDHEIATLKGAQPDEGDPHASNVKKSKDWGSWSKRCR